MSVSKKDLIFRQAKEDMLEYINEAIQHAKSDEERIELLVIKSEIMESILTEKRITI